MNHNSKYKNVIFDLGGVLVNWNPKQIITDIFKDRECMPFEMWQEYFRSESWQDFESGTISLSQFITMLPEKYDKKQIKYLLEKVHEHNLPLKSGLEIFDSIKSLGYKTYVLSNFGKEPFEKAKPNYTFLNRFDGIVVSYQAKAVKPYPEIYKILLDTYSLNPAESIFIDDLQPNIDGAKAMGIDGIVCKNHEHVWQELEIKGVIPVGHRKEMQKEVYRV